MIDLDKSSQECHFRELLKPQDMKQNGKKTESTSGPFLTTVGSENVQLSTMWL